VRSTSKRLRAELLGCERASERGLSATHNPTHKPPPSHFEGVGGQPARRGRFFSLLRTFGGQPPAQNTLQALASALTGASQLFLKSQQQTNKQTNTRAPNKHQRGWSREPHPRPPPNVTPHVSIATSKRFTLLPRVAISSLLNYNNPTHNRNFCFHNIRLV
jgi:hypothetical protein